MAKYLINNIFLSAARNKHDVTNQPEINQNIMVFIGVRRWMLPNNDQDKYDGNMQTGLTHIHKLWSS